MTEPQWLDAAIVLDVHGEQAALFGGSDGVRDPALLELALARPLNKFAYGETNLSVLAAAYAFRLARGHPFIEGNKRLALASMIVFLGLNGIDFRPPAEQATAVIFGIATGEMDENDLVTWIAENIAAENIPAK